MGYLDNSSRVLDAILTKKGREVLSSGGDFNVTKFALGDDEIDYGLWDETQPANLQGRVIENMPLLESFVNQKEIMNSFIIDPPEIPYGSIISNVLNTVVFEGKEEIIDIIPTTENHGDIEEYEFFLEHDNLFEMYNPFTNPISNFSMSIYIGDAPTSDFNMSVATPAGVPPVANFTMTI